MRNRKVHVIRKEWLAGGSKERLLRILKPQPYIDTYVPFGPARVLRAIDVIMHDGQIRTFEANIVIRDESVIIKLLPLKVLAKLDDLSAVMCANKRYEHRFDLIESVAQDFPVYEVLRLAQFEVSPSVKMSFYPVDWIKDGSHCRFLAEPQLREQSKDYLKEVWVEQFTCCPSCKNIAKDAQADFAAVSKFD